MDFQEPAESANVRAFVAVKTLDVQTQTPNSQMEWSQGEPPPVPTIWGRLYYTTPRMHTHCDKGGHTHYIDLVADEITLERTLSCQLKMTTKDNREHVCKEDFILKRENSEPLSPAVIVDCSYNGTFVNGNPVGKGRKRVLEDNDVISVIHPQIKDFVFEDLMKNEQERVPEEVSRKYYVSRILGQGAFGQVLMVYNKETTDKYAMKIIKKNPLPGQADNVKNIQRIKNEIQILKRLEHPFIILTEEVIDLSDAVYIILDLMEEGDLSDRIVSEGKLTESHVKLLFRQIVFAVKYLHAQGITHRDIKPENILLQGRDINTIIKITDFGLSKVVDGDGCMKTNCGTPQFIAPEIVAPNRGEQFYGSEVDVWSLGVIFYACLSGYLPFSSDFSGTLEEQIIQGRFHYYPSDWAGLNVHAELLMRSMLTVEPKERITLDQILDHEWMQDPAIIARVDQLLDQFAFVSQLSVSFAVKKTGRYSQQTLSDISSTRSLETEESARSVTEPA